MSEPRMYVDLDVMLEGIRDLAAKIADQNSGPDTPLCLIVSPTVAGWYDNPTTLAGLRVSVMPEMPTYEVVVAVDDERYP